MLTVNAKIKTPSSKRWIERHTRDAYVKRAIEEGYRSRSVYKLMEINNKHNLFSPKKRVIDLGCAPGGWAQLVASLVHSTPKDPLVIGIDRLEVAPIPGVITIESDIFSSNVLRLLSDKPVDIVLSDARAQATGNRKIDHFRTMRLCERAADLARCVLTSGGTFLTKILMGEGGELFISDLKKDFSRVICVKPKASRMESAEIYVLSMGFHSANKFQFIEG